MGNWYQPVWCHKQTLSPPAHSSPTAHSEYLKLSPGLLLLHPCIQWGLRALGPSVPSPCNWSVAKSCWGHLALKSPFFLPFPMSPLGHCVIPGLLLQPPDYTPHSGLTLPHQPSISVVLSVVPRPPAPASPGNLLGPQPEWLNQKLQGWAQQSGFNTLYRGDSMPVKFKNHRSIVHRPAGSASPGSLLGMWNFRPHPRPTESGPTFCQDSKVIPLHNNVLEVLPSRVE